MRVLLVTAIMTLACACGQKSDAPGTGTATSGKHVNATGDLTRDMAKALLSNSTTCDIDKIPAPIDCLEKSGSVKMGIGDSGGWQWILIDDGIKAEASLDNSGSFRLVTPLRATILNVTGITGTMLGPDTKQVDFTFEVPEPPPSLLSCIRPADDLKGESLFRKYDDGWRLEKVEVKGALYASLPRPRRLTPENVLDN